MDAIDRKNVGRAGGAGNPGDRHQNEREASVRSNRTCVWLAVAGAVMLALSAGVASAQIREGRSEGYFLFQYTGSMSGEWTKHNDVTLKFDQVNLWGFGGGYNPTEMVGFDFDMLFGNDYVEATGAGATPGSSVTLTQGISYFNGRLNANFYPVEGRFTPLVTGGIGWTNMVTKVPGAPPIYTCSPAYWYWYCGYSYPSISSTSFTYNAGVGLRYDPPNSNFFLKLVYSWGWVDTNATKSTPHSEGAYITLGGKI